MDYVDCVESDDFPEGLKDFVGVIGIDVAIDIIDYCGGSILYFPSKKSVVRCARNRVIKSEFNGSNFRELAGRFEISEM
jgi:Mor family transcriptional regulator